MPGVGCSAVLLYLSCQRKQNLGYLVGYLFAMSATNGNPGPIALCHQQNRRSLRNLGTIPYFALPCSVIYDSMSTRKAFYTVLCTQYSIMYEHELPVRCISHSTTALKPHAQVPNTPKGPAPRVSKAPLTAQQAAGNIRKRMYAACACVACANTYMHATCTLHVCVQCVCQ
jgi:hypothetical protein